VLGGDTVQIRPPRVGDLNQAWEEKGEVERSETERIGLCLLGTMCRLFDAVVFRLSAHPAPLSVGEENIAFALQCSGTG
jgi:hypothetical protein